MLGHLQNTNTLNISDQNLMLYVVVVRLCDGYPQHTSDFQNIFAWLIFKIFHLPVYKFSNRMISSGLNNGRSKTGAVNVQSLLIMKEWKKRLRNISLELK